VTLPGWRNYRLDRIISLTPLDETAEFHDDGEDVWDKKVKEGQSVSLWVSEEARWLGEYHNATTVGVTSDGLTQIDVPVLSESWMIRLLLSLGSAVKRVEPETYSHRARQIAHQTLDAYRLLDGSVVRSDP
jgi:predicted DNA-binding transcriptional regulator YafY